MGPALKTKTHKQIDPGFVASPPPVGVTDWNASRLERRHPGKFGSMLCFRNNPLVPTRWTLIYGLISHSSQPSFLSKAGSVLPGFLKVFKKGFLERMEMEGTPSTTGSHNHDPHVQS